MGAEEGCTGAKSFSKVLASAHKMEIKITGDMVKRPILKVDKRATNICINDSQKQFIAARYEIVNIESVPLHLTDYFVSYAEAKALATAGITYIDSRGPNDPLYKAYWGALPFSQVISVLNAIATESSPART